MDIVALRTSRSWWIPIFLAVLGSGTLAGAASWEDGYLEYFTNAFEPVSLAIRPDGQGTPFTMAYTSYGSQIDATITLSCYNIMYDPVPGIPAEDFWLEAWDPVNLVFCVDGNIPDGPTDVYGQTTFTLSPSGGGYTTDNNEVIVANSLNLLRMSPAMDMNFNSPDFNGDQVVNLTDVIIFAGDWYGSYQYRSDLKWDGVINLSDLVLLVYAMGGSCTLNP